MIPFEIPHGMDPDAAFRLCVQISQFSAKLDDGNCVDVPRKYDEWTVDHRYCNLEMIEKEVAKRVDWGSCQRLRIYEFDTGSSGERELVDDNALACAFAESGTDHKLFLFVDVEDRPLDLGCKSGLSEVVTSNAVTDAITGQVNSSTEKAIPYLMKDPNMGARKFMALYAKRRRIGQKFEGHVMLPIVVRQLQTMSRQLGHLKLTEGGLDEAEVSEITRNHKVIRHVVNIKNHTCTCREWQVSGKPCPHGLALIITNRQHKMDQYLHPYYSVRNFRLAYSGVIKPLTDKSQWAHVDLEFKLKPPLQKREVGRQRKNRIPSCLEHKGNKAKSKGKWQVQCSNCLGHGHRSTSPKCPLNGTKKRKSRAKPGRKPGPGKAEAGPSTPKRQKVAVNEIAMNTSPAMNTRRQIALIKEAAAGTSQEVNSTTTVEVITSTPVKKKRAVKKLTPRKQNN